MAALADVGASQSRTSLAESASGDKQANNSNDASMQIVKAVRRARMLQRLHKRANANLRERSEKDVIYMRTEEEACTVRQSLASQEHRQYLARHKLERQKKLDSLTGPNTLKLMSAEDWLEAFNEYSPSLAMSRAADGDARRQRPSTQASASYRSSSYGSQVDAFPRVRMPATERVLARGRPQASIDLVARIAEAERRQATGEDRRFRS